MYYKEIDENDILSRHEFYDHEYNLIPELTDGNLNTYFQSGGCTLTADFGIYPYACDTASVFRCNYDITTSGNTNEIIMEVMVSGETWEEIGRTDAIKIPETYKEEFSCNVHPDGIYGTRIRVTDDKEFTPLVTLAECLVQTSGADFGTILSVGQNSLVGELFAGNYWDLTLNSEEYQTEIFLPETSYDVLGSTVPFYITNNFSGVVVENVTVYVPEVSKNGQPEYSDEFMISTDGVLWKNNGELLDIGDIQPLETKRAYVKSNISSNRIIDSHVFFGRLVVEGLIDG